LCFEGNLGWQNVLDHLRQRRNGKQKSPGQTASSQSRRFQIHKWCDADNENSYQEYENEEDPQFGKSDHLREVYRTTIWFAQAQRQIEAGPPL